MIHESAAPAAPPRVRFPGLSSTAFEHPSDRAALEALRRTPGLDRVLRKLSDLGAERLVRLRFTADSIRVSPRQCRRLYNDLREACAILDVREPELYLSQYPFPQAVAFGMERHMIVVTSALVDLLDDTERLNVLGRELGHIKADHMLYRTMAMILADLLADVSKYVGLGRVVTDGLVYAFHAWFRRSELTADRAGLLTVQDARVCTSAMLKLVAGSQKLIDDLNPDELARQADLYDDLEEDFLSAYYQFLLIRFRSQPFPAVRAREILEWADSEEYRHIMRGEYPRRSARAGHRKCPRCDFVVTNVTFQFCPECGAALPVVTPEFTPG